MSMGILNGWNTFGSEALDQRAISATTKRGKNKRSTKNVTVCKTMKEVRESLQIDASAAVTYGDFSASLKAGYMRSLQMTSNSVVVLARVVLEEKEEIDVAADDLKLLVSLETEEDRRNFFRKYGDSYISSVTRGYEILISYVLHATSREEKIKVSSKLEGSGVAGGANISASFAMEMENFSKESGVSWSIKTEALGLGISVDPKNIEAAVKAVEDQDPTKSDFVISFEATPYTRLIDDSAESRQVTANLEALQGSSARAGWAGQFEKLREVKQAIDRVASVYDVYGYEGDPDLQTRLSDVTESEHQVGQFIRDVGKKPWEAADFPAPDPRMLEEPSLNFTVRASDVRFGGETDTRINYGMFGAVTDSSPTYDRSSVRKGERIHRIRVYMGDWFNGLAVTYREELSPLEDRTVSNQNATGNMVLDVELAKGLGIVSIHGLSGDGVNALEFEIETPDGGTRKVRAGNMNAGGLRPATWKAGEGEFLLGFQGYGGNWLNTLVPIVVTFYPAKWGRGR